MNVEGSSQVSVASSRFYNSSATFRGGALFAEGDTSLNISGSTFSDITAPEGGVVSIEESSKLSVVNSSFSSNTAQRGAALYLIDSAGCSVVSSSFRNNTAGRSGGAIELKGSANASVLDSTFSNNTAGSFGGAVSLGEGSPLLSVVSSRFNHNSATGAGGALFAEGDGSTNISSGTSFINNTAGQGGAVNLQDRSNFTCRSSNVIYNRAIRIGGGFYARDNASVSLLQGCNASYNSAARSGAGVYSHLSAEVTIASAALCNNTSGASGGGVFADDQALIKLLNGAAVLGNTAETYGGGLFLEQQSALQLLPESARVWDNSAGLSGGGFYFSSPNFDPAAVVQSNPSPVAPDSPVAAQNRAVFDANVAVKQQMIVIVSDTAVDQFVSTPGSTDGLLTVLVNTSGWHGLPTAGVTVEALLDGKQFLAVNRTDDKGLAHMLLKVRQPPGKYNIVFTPTRALSDMASNRPQANLTLHIRSCIQGVVTPSPDSCLRCPPGSFSFEPTSTECTRCMPNAECVGGSVVIPKAGFWSSSATAGQTHSVLVVAFFFFVPVLHIVFSLFACMRLDTAASPPYHPAAVGSWWVLDTSQQCFTGWHAKWALGLGLPLMFVVCLVLPVCVAALTLRNRQQRRLTNPWVIMHWGFLYSAYRTQHCYWEAVVLLQTTGLVAISTFGATMAVWYQSICMTYALAVIVLMQAVWRPHALAATRAVSMQSMCCLLFTSSLGMSFLTLPGGPQPGAAYAEVVGAVMVLLHAGFVGSVVWRLLRGVDWASQRMACAQVLQRLKLDALCCAGVYMPASNKEAMGVSWGTSRQPSATAAAVLRERPVERLGRDRKPAAAAYGQRAPATAP
uniref:Right handed beta helix domain-containing protein n=1 Tax=Tetradesmus obliquus TaxID=3088 RepID=A0A383WJB8_TETOB|eukprot:jgi/Sobl393_1/972/SZX77560.1